MSLSRWKMMAGVLGVSIGGLAAAASQCPKLDMSKGRSPEAPVAKADPKLPPAGAPTVPPPEVPAAPSSPAIPAAPNLVPAVATPPAPPAPLLGTPSLPAVPPASADVPKGPAPTGALPLPDATTSPALPLPKHHDVTPSGGTLPQLPSAPAGTKSPDSKSGAPLPPPVSAPTPGDLIPPPPAMPSKPTQDQKEAIPPSAGIALPDTSNFEKMIPQQVKQPVASPPVTSHEKSPLIPPVFGASGAQSGVTPPSTGGTLPPPPLSDQAPADVPLSKPTFAPPASAPAVAEPKFRIILRVGEGEPTFEVKNGDNLVLKVACEKVDIESVEKGTGLSKVTARGKVRFAGFGAEGSCDALSFIAGTGEVQMTGEVKVQVKDKLGRVESELTTAAMKYKIDASAVGGALKP